MRVAIYGRVSKADGSQTIENQLLELRRLAESQNWVICKEFLDHDSGAKSDREQFREMLADASRRKFDVLLVWASDRLTREGAYETMHYVRMLDGYGVRFRSYTESFLDSTGPFRDLLIALGLHGCLVTPIAPTDCKRIVPIAPVRISLLLQPAFISPTPIIRNCIAGSRQPFLVSAKLIERFGGKVFGAIACWMPQRF